MNFDDELFDTPEEIAVENAQALASAREDFPDLERRFGPASFGNHEALDRAHMIQETWERYIVNHPSIALCPEAFAMAVHAQRLMLEVYALMGRFETNAEGRRS